MSQSKLMLSRAQLEAFLGEKDPDAIRAFERLFTSGDAVDKFLEEYTDFGVGKGSIELGGNATDGYYRVTADGWAECWGWGFVRWVSGA